MLHANPAASSVQGQTASGATFVYATGKLAKTDRPNSETLARFGMLLNPRLLHPNAASFAELKELHAARLALLRTGLPRIVGVRTSPSRSSNDTNLFC